MIDRIHLIGNSPILSGSGLGEEIDSCPVVRINTAPTSGYEDDVGSRTDARVVCGNLQMGRHDEWLSTLSGETLILYPTPEDIRKNAQRLTSADNSLRYLHGEAIEVWTKFLDESPLEERPTSGLYGAWFLSNIAKEVHLYGFGFHRSSGSDHYWEDLNTGTPGHNHETEKTMLESMDGVVFGMKVPDKH